MRTPPLRGRSPHLDRRHGVLRGRAHPDRARGEARGEATGRLPTERHHSGCARAIATARRERASVGACIQLDAISTPGGRCRQTVQGAASGGRQPRWRCPGSDVGHERRGEGGSYGVAHVDWRDAEEGRRRVQRAHLARSHAGDQPRHEHNRVVRANAAAANAATANAAAARGAGRVGEGTRRPNEDARRAYTHRRLCAAPEQAHQLHPQLSGVARDRCAPQSQYHVNRWRGARGGGGGGELAACAGAEGVRTDALHGCQLASTAARPPHQPAAQRSLDEEHTARAQQVRPTAADEEASSVRLELACGKALGEVVPPLQALAPAARAAHGRLQLLRRQSRLELPM